MRLLDIVNFLFASLTCSPLAPGVPSRPGVPGDPGGPCTPLIPGIPCRPSLPYFIFKKQLRSW